MSGEKEKRALVSAVAIILSSSTNDDAHYTRLLDTYVLSMAMYRHVRRWTARPALVRAYQLRETSFHQVRFLFSSSVILNDSFYFDGKKPLWVDEPKSNEQAVR